MGEFSESGKIEIRNNTKINKISWGRQSRQGVKMLHSSVTDSIPIFTWYCELCPVATRNGVRANLVSGQSHESDANGDTVSPKVLGKYCYICIVLLVI